MNTACVGAAALAVLTAAPGRAQSAPTCPDSTESPTMVAYLVDKAFADWSRQPSAAPPSCLALAVARSPLTYSDSTVLQALAFADDARRRSPEDADALSARVPLLYRAGRYAAVGPAFDELFGARPSRLTQDLYRLTVAAAMRMNDTAAIINRLANAAQRFGSAPLFGREYDVWRQMTRLHLVVDTVQRRLKAEPTLVEANSILSSIYGNLDRPDSALFYARIALGKGVRRAVVAEALESLIGRELRRAQIMTLPEVWSRTLPVALRIDSTLSTPASKYLVAITYSEIVADGVRLARAIDMGIASGATGGYGRLDVRADGETVRHVMTCERVMDLRRSITKARAALEGGGDQFAPQTIPALRTGLDQMDASLVQLAARCAS